MHLLSLLLLLTAGACEVVYWQKLTCPYEGKHERLLRVWCRQSSADCCHGLAFSQRQHSVDGGHLKVTQGSDSFTVALLQPSHGEGLYWCGVLSTNNTVIKLAEGYFHSSLAAYIWSLTRWILLPLLPMATIFATLYSRAITKHTLTAAEERGDDVTELADPQYENAASSCQLE
ncbi:uncharacterized protein si:ch211-102c2.4 isoform X2 [Perca fluviatilis]|uniref:uncharacterized protein si:ch211-102c2.4 isoform X2 n=1 Tax=Perca fluviatilis TaxID=8168 RepID=UPI00196258C4|nr:uncharacterized protein si:ch211-102c2.4 isoform X2 [Perca fluviatilis]